MKLPVFKPNKTTWFVGIAITAITVVWMIVIFPALQRLQSTAQAIVETQATEASSTEATANLISVLQRRTELADAAKQLDSFFIDRSNPVAFVGRLEELGVDHNVTLDISLQEPDSNVTGPVAETAVDITAAGTMNDVLDFMNTLLTDPVFLEVTTITITTPSDTPGIITLRLEMTSYWK